MKKFYNFLKKEEERALWEKEANPEDIEYIKCQEELADQLLNKFIEVERVIGARLHQPPEPSMHLYHLININIYIICGI